MMMVMLIDGAIAAQQAESAECREIPPGVTAWSAAKALIYSKAVRCDDKLPPSDCRAASRQS